MICKGCKKNDDLRFGWCFDCTSKGEKRAASRGVIEHIIKGLKNISTGSLNFKYDFKWAWQRLTKTGDYSRFGYFEREYGTDALWGIPNDFISNCRNCKHPIWKHHRNYRFNCGGRSEECACKKYVPLDNLEYLEYKCENNNRW